jgi:hypothetical protein
LNDFYRLRILRRMRRLTRIGEILLRAKPAGWPDYVRARRFEFLQNKSYPPSRQLSSTYFPEGSFERNQASQRVSRAKGFHLFESAGACGAKTVTDKKNFKLTHPAPALFCK